MNNRENTLLSYANMILDICNKNNCKIYDGFVPMIGDLYSEEYGIFTDGKISDLSRKLDVSVLRMGDPEGVGQKKKYQFIRFHEVTPKELRKKCGMYAPKPYLMEFTIENRSKPIVAPFIVKNDVLKVFESPNDIPITNEAKVDLYNTAQNMIGMQFNLENQPRVYLKPENAEIGFTLPIDSLSQVKELFSLRDIPDGYKRRVALLHWVSKHLRRKPSNPNERIEVQKHLRGREDFEWFGIKGTIFNEGVWK